MGQKVIFMFWWEFGLLSASRNHLLMIRFRGESPLSFASRNHLTTFCRPFAHYACLRLCSAMVHVIRNNCLC